MTGIWVSRTVELQFPHALNAISPAAATEIGNTSEPSSARSADARFIQAKRAGPRKYERPGGARV